MIVDGKRALAYTVQIDNIEPIVGADNIEMATVGGWKVIVKKGEFVPKEIAVFFEIDSKLPEEERRNQILLLIGFFIVLFIIGGIGEFIRHKFNKKK